jgi:hypothetical protein
VNFIIRFEVNGLQFYGSKNDQMIGPKDTRLTELEKQTKINKSLKTSQSSILVSRNDSKSVYLLVYSEHFLHLNYEVKISAFILSCSHHPFRANECDW